MSSRLLRKEKMTIKMFVLLLVFPFATILYWIFARKQTGNDLDAHSAVTESPGEKENIQNETSKELLSVIEGPFRKSEPLKICNNCRFPWQSVLIARRLILITIKTFLFNTVVKLHGCNLWDKHITSIQLYVPYLCFPIFTRAYWHIY